VNGLLLACWIAAGPLAADAAWDAGAGDAAPAAAPDAAAAVQEAGPQEAAPAAPAPETLLPLAGRVVAKGTREPLAAAISVDGVPQTDADEDGRFRLALLPGPHRLQIQQPGYDTIEDAVVVGTATPDRIYRMAPRLTGERYETVVTSPDTRAHSVVLREEELTQVPGSFGDPFRVIESLPGVSQVAWPLAIYVVRGANPGNTGFFIDGVRVPAIFHFALGPSVIHPYLLKEVNFYPGGYPAQYGRYTAGIVTAETGNPPTDRAHVSADARLFDAGGLVVSPFDQGRGSVAVGGRVSYTGLIFSALQSRVDFNYWDYQLRVEHRLGPGKLSLFAFGSNDHLRYEPSTGGDTLSTANQDQKADLSFHRAQLRWAGAVGGGQASAGMLVGRDRSATLLELVSDQPITVNMLTAAPQLRYTHPLASWGDAEVGGDAEFQHFTPLAVMRDEVKDQDLFHERDATQGGAYLGFSLRSGSRVVVSPVLRYEMLWEQGVRRYEPSPRLNVRVRPAGDVWLKASVGRYAQFASLALQVPGFESFGLATYGPQWSIQTSVGVEAPLKGAVTLDANVFYQRFQLTDLESIYNADPARPNVVELRDGESYGVELMLRRPLTERLSGWIAYTLSKSDRLIGYYRTKSPSDWDQRHILNVVLGYRLRGGWSVSGRVHYNTGRPYPVYQKCTFRVDYQRLPPFFQLDGRIDKRFVFDRFVMSAYLELVNSTLSREAYDIKRNCDDTLDEKGFRIVLPSVGVHAEW
jgi:hypothetical protein